MSFLSRLFQNVAADKTAAVLPPIAALWREFEEWLAVHWPDGMADLNPGASDEQLRALEAVLGVTLPTHFVECLKIRNGQKGSAGGLFDNSEFLSTDAIVDQWNVWRDLLESGEFEGITSEAEPGVCPDWWNRNWIPFTHNGGGDHYCLDLQPATGGAPGQIITMWHDMGERRIVAVNFHAWLADYLASIRAGKIVYSEDFGGLVNSHYVEP
jgi:cell wall assembly regulator SMI1